MLKTSFFLLQSIPLVWFLYGCGPTEKIINVDLTQTVEVNRQPKSQKRQVINFAVGSMNTPKAGFTYYWKLLKYIEEKSDFTINYIGTQSYSELTGMMGTGKVDMAFICPGPYVHSKEPIGLELLVAPLAYGKAEYKSFIIVAQDSRINDFSELRGKSFAFTDPKSNSGTLYPVYLLAKLGETPDSFFSQFIFTYAHDKSIEAVKSGIVDGAAVENLIWKYILKQNPAITQKVKVINKSQSFGISPVVVRKDVDHALKERIRNIFLEMHRDAEGKKILEKMMLDKFTLIEDKDYDSIRDMILYIKKQNRKNWLTSKASCKKHH
jgi:phosphonate transport system substrate-binding protein